jgi:hypothetical protein
MNDKNTGGPAFPVPGLHRSDYNNGMSLRDYFAANAMQGFCGNPANRDALPKEIAFAAYRQADALLKAREA